jgi:hypothetical protein
MKSIFNIDQQDIIHVWFGVQAGLTSLAASEMSLCLPY